MAGWCNGSAGFVQLFSLAWEAYGNKSFLETAIGAGWDVWDSRKIRAYDLCCGLAGRAYSLLTLYRCTGDVAWLNKARRLAERAVEKVGIGQENPFPNSLYRGELGVAILAAELQRPEEASMPLFGPEDWAST
jgi:serine/threonine-protein kinase